MNIGFQKNSDPKDKNKGHKEGFFSLARVKGIAKKGKEPKMNIPDIEAKTAMDPSGGGEGFTQVAFDENANFFNLNDIDNSSGEQIAIGLQLSKTEARDFSMQETLQQNFNSYVDNDLEEQDSCFDKEMFDVVNGDSKGDEISSNVETTDTKEAVQDDIFDVQEELAEDDFNIDFSVMDDIDLSLEENNDTSSEEITRDSYDDYSVVTDSDVEATKMDSDNHAFVYVEQNSDVINDVEYEALLNLFSTLTPTEVEALPENYRKLFNQNFKPNETYVGDAENNSIRKKLGLRELDLRKIDNSVFHLSSEEITATLKGVELPVSVIQKLLPEGKKLEDTENLEKIKAKILSIDEMKNDMSTATNDCNDTDKPLIAINYCDDAVPDVMQLGECSLGILPYKIFKHGKLLKANSNYEITLDKGDIIFVRTGIRYITTPNCKVDLMGPSLESGLNLLEFNVSNDSIDLKLEAERNTYINKNSILCKINYEES